MRVGKDRRCIGQSQRGGLEAQLLGLSNRACTDECASKDDVLVKGPSTSIWVSPEV